jgi:CRP-like cAMP-binding protein
VKEIRAALEQEWPKLIKEGIEVSFRKGQDVFYKDHAPMGAFFVLSGKVKLWGGGNLCHDLCHWQSPKGDIYGVRSILKDESFCCTATAATDCRIIFIPRQRLLKWAADLGRTV